MITTSKTLLITAIKSFKSNLHDSKTIVPLLAQQQVNINYIPKEIIYDRGAKGQKQIGQTTITTPDYKPLECNMPYQKNVKRKKFRR